MNFENELRSFLDFFKGNPIFNAISLLLAIAGLLLTFYFYFKSKRKRIPTYIIRTINLVKEKMQKIEIVEILYAGEKINNLSISKIAVWNDGEETINSTDVALSNPIQIRIKDDFEILDTEILYQKNDANDFKVKLSDDNKFITVSFDYFDFEEGVILQIFHTGNQSSDLLVDGKIKSVKKIRRKEFSDSILPFSFLSWLRKDKSLINRKKVRLIMGCTFLIVGIVMSVVMLLSPFRESPAPVNPEPKKLSLWFGFFGALPGLLYVWLGYNMLRKRIPKGFNIFIEEF